MVDITTSRISGYVSLQLPSGLARENGDLNILWIPLKQHFKCSWCVSVRHWTPSTLSSYIRWSEKPCCFQNITNFLFGMRAFISQLQPNSMKESWDYTVMRMCRISLCSKARYKEDMCICNLEDFGKFRWLASAVAHWKDYPSKAEVACRTLGVFLAWCLCICLFPWVQPTGNLENATLFFRWALLTPTPTPSPWLKSSCMFCIAFPFLDSANIYGG